MRFCVTYYILDFLLQRHYIYIARNSKNLHLQTVWDDFRMRYAFEAHCILLFEVCTG